MPMSTRGHFERPRGRRPTWGWGVSAIALLCLLGQTSALMHQVLVQHATCAEHGESVHVAAPTRAAAGAAVAEQPGFDVAVVEEAERHEHCAGADTRGATPRLVPDQAGELVPPRALAPPSLATVLVPAVAAYVIAPKTSPPRTAS